jgi:hypothetical protein
MMSTISAKLLEPLPTILSRALAAALKPESNEDIRSAALKLFDCLVDPTRGVENDPHQNLYQPTTDQLYGNQHLYMTLLSRHSSWTLALSTDPPNLSPQVTPKSSPDLLKAT